MRPTRQSNARLATFVIVGLFVGLAFGGLVTLAEARLPPPSCGRYYYQGHVYGDLNGATFRLTNIKVYFYHYGGPWWRSTTTDSYGYFSMYIGDFPYGDYDSYISVDDSYPILSGPKYFLWDDNTCILNDFYPTASHQVNRLFMAQSFLTGANGLSPTTYMDGLTGWQASSSLQVQQSETIGATTYYGAAALGYGQDFTQSITTGQPLTAFGYTLSGIFFPSAEYLWTQDTSGNTESNPRINTAYALQQAGLSIADGVSLATALANFYGCAPNGCDTYQKGVTSGIILRSSINSANPSPTNPYVLREVQVSSSHGQTSFWSVTLGSGVTFKYDDSLTTSQTWSWTIGSEAIASIPSGYNVLIWVAASNPMVMHTYMCPTTTSGCGS